TTTGNNTINLTGLTCGTTYHYRAYATKIGRAACREKATITTSACPTAPSVTTGSSSSITQTSANVIANVTSTGGSAVTQVGVQYGLDGTYGSSTPSSTTTTGNNTVNLTGLTCGTTYHYRAYAT